MDKRNVLIFPAGSGIDVYYALRNNIHFSVYGISGVSDHAEYVYDQSHIRVSEDYYITSPCFLSAINKIIHEWNINYIIPTHDTIATVLLEYGERIDAEIICSPLETAIIAENKKLTYEELKEKPYFPKVYSNLESENIEYPVFIKPYVAAGGKGTKIAYNEEQKRLALIENSDVLICEYLPGKELTVDCFTNRSRELLFVGPRTRERITLGVTYRSERVELLDEIKSIAQDLNNRFVFRGLWYFQVKEDAKGKLKLMEFSVRHAGTMTYYRQLGVNFPLLSLFDFMGYDVEIICNSQHLILDRGIETKYKLSYYYDTVYVDFDDTIIVNQQVNLDMIKFLYQCSNQKKRIVLLTKHIFNIYESLEKYKVSQNLFDVIINIESDKSKSDYITEKKSIFIDNYYWDRQKVYKEHQIPVFDVDAINCLLV